MSYNTAWIDGQNYTIKNIVEILKTLDTYTVEVDEDNCLYTERNIEGEWVNAHDISLVIEKIQSWVK